MLHLLRHTFAYLLVFSIKLNFIYNQELLFRSDPNPPNDTIALVTRINTLIPLKKIGTCYAGKTLKPINTMNDLRFNNSEDLECIYASGIVPNTIPMGEYYGQLISVFNSELLDLLVSFIWKGKFGFQLFCNNQIKEFSVNYIANRFRFPATLSLGQFDATFGEEEHLDNKGAFWLDYKSDSLSKCLMSNTTIHNLTNFSQPNNSIVNKILDAARIVGRIEDGADIYLGKTYVQKAFQEKNAFVTAAFFAFKNYSNNTLLRYNESLPQLTETFTYINPGPLDFFIPFDL